MRWQDIIGLAGLSIWAFGLALLFPASAHDLNFKYMLGGCVLWLLGFVPVVGWFLWRWFAGAPRGRPDLGTTRGRIDHGRTSGGASPRLARGAGRASEWRARGRV